MIGIEQYLSEPSSFNERIPKVIGASNIQNLGLEVGILTKVDPVAFADVVTIVDQLLVQVVKFVIVGDHTHAGLRGKYLFGLDLQGERSGLPFIEETVVEQFAGFSLENE
jgi:hypothetical protein